MGMLKTNEAPAYRQHKASGQAVVTMSGRDHYLGPFNSDVSHTKYRRLVNLWWANGRKLPRHMGGVLLVKDLVEQYRDHAGRYYRKHGRLTTFGQKAGRIAGELAKLYGDLPAVPTAPTDPLEPTPGFGPKDLEGLREFWIRRGVARIACNDYAQVVLRIYRWGVAQGLVAPTALVALQAVEPLRKGRTPAPEHAPIRAVSWELVEPVLATVTEVMRDALLLQWHTGMRPGEPVVCRPCDVDRSGPVWLYRPWTHKTEHRDREKVVTIGPKGQAVLGPRLEGVGEHWAFPSPLKAGRHLLAASVCNAVALACERLKLPHWSPNQIRHSFATRVSRQYRRGERDGKEAAKASLGHADLQTTEGYIDKDLETAIGVARELG